MILWKDVTDGSVLVERPDQSVLVDNVTGQCVPVVRCHLST